MSRTRHVVITGASSGFGRALAETFLMSGGWIVHATSRSGNGFETIAEDMRPRLRVYSLDLMSSESRSRFATAIQQVDVLINNAGFGMFGALEDLSEEQIRRQMEVNFTGTVLLTQALLPLLRRQRGHILNMSSAFGFSGFPLTSMYCASKFALEGWSESLRYELHPHGVAVTLIQPGAHRTKFAASAEWGAGSMDSASAFYDQSRGYKNLMHRLSSRPRPQRPEAVAERVFKIAGQAKPPFRLRCGKDAQASYWMRRVFPLPLLLRVYDSAFRRLLRPHGAV